MSGPDRIWAWAWETNPQMGHWTTDQHIGEDGVEYVRIDEVNAIIADADRRTEMHECAMEERDDCIEDWSKANDQICRLTAELDAMRAALKPITAQDAARVPEIAALIEAAKVLHTNAVATKARTIGGVCGQTIDCMLRSTFHQASIYDLDALSDALRAIAVDRA